MSSNTQDDFKRACALWDEGKYRQAFNLFRRSAENRDPDAQVNLAHFYSEGLGVRRSIEKALYWYRRAYRAGSAIAASNMGILLLAEGKQARAVQWFERGLRLGDDGAALELGKHHLTVTGNVAEARRYLRRAANSKKVSEDTASEAAGLLERMEA
jgi:hypothetical protein